LQIGLGTTDFYRWLDPGTRVAHIAGHITGALIIFPLIACFGYLLRKIAVRSVALAQSFYIATFKRTDQ
jgi:hypothetical protein